MPSLPLTWGNGTNKGLIQAKLTWGSLDGSVVKNLLPLQETQVRSLIWNIPHAEKQLNLNTTTIEPVLWNLGATTTEPIHLNYRSLHTLEPVFYKRSYHNEKPAHRNQRGAPCLLQLKKSRAANQKTQHNQTLLLSRFSRV